MGEREIPLCVDVEHTLLQTNVFLESLAAFPKSRSLRWWLLLRWFLKGRAHFEEMLISEVRIDISTLPVHSEFLSFLQAEHAKGRLLVMTTDLDKLMAQQVADYFGLFHEVISSKGDVYRAGEEKAAYLVSRFGEGGFDYAGDEATDIMVWKSARERILVSSTAKHLNMLNRSMGVSRLFGSIRSKQSVLTALRPRQWTKNLLIFLPIIMAHKVTDISVLGHTLLAFLIFCLTASSGYVLNDLLDLESDRSHPLKCLRPFAHGDVSLAVGMLLMPLLFVTAVLLSLFLPWTCLFVLFIYLVSTTLYSLRAKQIPILDIIVLASLYTLRAIYGGLAGPVLISQWLLAFSVFLFFSLACVKRYSELFALRQRNGFVAKGRGYCVDDLPQVAAFGVASGYLSVLVMALYVNSPEVTVLYTHPPVLMFLCPPILYWISRIWLEAARGNIDEDPLVFATSDSVSYKVGVLCLTIMLLAL